MDKTIRTDKTAHKIFLDRKTVLFPFSEQEMCLCVQLLLINRYYLTWISENTGLPGTAALTKKTAAECGSDTTYRQKGQKYPLIAINCGPAVLT